MNWQRAFAPRPGLNCDPLSALLVGSGQTRRVRQRKAPEGHHSSAHAISLAQAVPTRAQQPVSEPAMPLLQPEYRCTLSVLTILSSRATIRGWMAGKDNTPLPASPCPCKFPAWITGQRPPLVRQNALCHPFGRTTPRHNTTPRKALTELHNGVPRERRIHRLSYPLLHDGQPKVATRGSHCPLIRSAGKSQPSSPPPTTSRWAG